MNITDFGGEESMPVLNRFHNSLASMRSHHWKYYADLFSRCRYSCKYCLYHGIKSGTIDNETSLILLGQELKTIQKERGVVYLGATADVYQEGADLGITKEALELFLKHRRPVFLITRSPQVLFHTKFLKDMADQGLIEVSITINSRNDLFRSVFEPGTASHETRIQVARKLVDAGVPVSFHFSPIVPGLDTSEELLAMMAEMVDVGGRCIYACLYGMRTQYQAELLTLFESLKPGLAATMAKAYQNDDGGEIVSPANELALKVIEPLAEYAKANGITFVSAQFPSYDFRERSEGIFREKLPTVGDLLRTPVPACDGHIQLEELLQYAKSFPAVDDEYLEAISQYWSSGELFKNTTLSPVTESGVVKRYSPKSYLDVDTRVMHVNR